MSKARHPPKSSFGANQSQDNRVVKATVHYTTVYSSSAGGVIANAQALDPSGCSDWSEFSSTYDEFRVIGVGVEICSTQPNSTGVNSGIMAIALDNDSSAAPSTFTAVREYTTSQSFSTIMTHPGGKLWTKQFWRPVKGAPIPWVDMGGPSGSLGSIQMYGSGLTASTQYLVINYDYYVEFRGRR